MESLAGTRVVIVDDRFDEVAALIDALSRRQIASCWFTGDPDGLPEGQERLRHVRLAFLDIDLQGGGIGGHAKVSHLVNVLTRLLSPSSAGYGVILWTKHAEELGDFVETLIRNQLPLPLFVTAISKTDCQKDGRYELALIEKRLKKCLSDALPWRILWQWEMDSIGASGHLVNDLAEATKPAAAPTAQEFKRWQKTWGNNLSALLLKLAREEFGDENVTSGAEVVRGAYSAMAPLQIDSMEGIAVRSAALLRGPGRAIFNRAATLSLPGGLVGRINEKLALTEPTHKWTLAGNVYLAGSRGLRRILTTLPDKKKMVADSVQDLPDTDAMFGSAELVLIEISPICDYAQNKIRQCRLLAGVKIPAANFKPKKLKKSAPFLWTFGPYAQNGSDWHLMVDFRQLFNCSPTALGRITVAYKLRQQVLGDLQSRFAAHATRAGILSMH